MIDTQYFPLVVDLDGTLTPTDTLVESIILVVRRSPAKILRIPMWLAGGRASFKDSIAQLAVVRADRLPYRESLLSYLDEQRSRGRRIILATAANRRIADSVARHLHLFDQVIASDAQQNLKGAAKLAEIRRVVGDEFVYAGDRRADLSIWRAARAAVLVGASPSVVREVRRLVPVELEIPANRFSLKTLLSALRVHQWLKNLLLFVPLFTAFSFMDLAKIGTALIAFLAFSLAASASYVVNDILDLENDRAHPRKKNRPFANASIPIPQGLALAAALLVVAAVLASLVSWMFAATLAGYLVLTSAYTWVLKEYVLIDVLVLAILYTTRIGAGAVVVDVAVSSWLLAFSVFIFMSLALVKRCAELIVLQSDGFTASQGRDYRASDLTVLWPLGVGCAMSAVVVFGLFINAPETQARYIFPQALWVGAIGLIYWLGRVWIKTSRGEMHDDPVVFAIRDRGSRYTMLLLAMAVVGAKFVPRGWFA